MRLFEGIAPLLEELRRREVKLGLVSSKTREQYARTFQRLGFDDAFVQIICADLTEKHKPYPEPIEKFFELTGLERNRPYLLHGLDVGYATIITSRLRERVMAGRPLPEEKPPDRKAWEKEIRDVFGRGADNILRLQESGGTGQSLRPKITRRWEEIRAVLAEAPKAEQIQDILQSVDYDFDAFLRYYGSDWVNEAVRYARYTKTYYTLLCLNQDVDSEPVVF